ncbi:MAG: hypothetical protein JXQ93_13895 [Flavobacteriaceae bacterium]
MKNLSFLLFVLFFSCSKNNNQIQFAVSKISENNDNYLQVSVNNKTGENGKTIYIFEDKKWGEKDLHNLIKNLKVLNAIAEIEFKKDSGWIIIKHPKDLNQLQLSYEIHQDTDSLLSVFEAFRPVVSKTGFSSFSHNLFMLPKHMSSPINVDIVWKGFPKDYTLINSFGEGEFHQEIKNIETSDFHASKFVGGDYKKYNIDIDGNKLTFGIKDKWKTFEDSTLVEVLKKTVKSQRDFWQDHSQKYFSVTLTPSYEEHYGNFLGTGLTNSFSTIAANNKDLQVESLVYLFNHELQHNWNGHTILKENEEEQYWFSEGFTDYYTIKNIARNTIYNLDEGFFIKKMNEFIKKLHTSSVKEAPNSEINYDNFWSNQEYEKLPYRRGAIFAFYLDMKIKKETKNKKNLDNIMLHIKNEAVKNGQKINNEYFVEVFKKLIGIDIALEFDTYIEQGKLIDLKKFFNDNGFDFSDTSFVFDKGFTFSKDRKYIAEIDETSNAYKAGLRKGDEIVPLQYDSNRINFMAKIKVIKNMKETIFTYLPKKEILVPSLKDTKNNYQKLNL